jgi:hypothetical protein
MSLDPEYLAVIIIHMVVSVREWEAEGAFSSAWTS